MSRRTKVVGEPGPSSTTPALLGFLVLSGDTYEQLKGFFRWRSVELDRASGFELHLIDVGNPAVSGELYKLAQSEAARIDDAEAAQLFVDELQPAERVDAHRLRVMDKLATMLAVRLEERPCIVFAGAGKFEAIATFRIEPAWYSTQEARSVLVDALRDWIANLKLDGSAAMLGGRAALAATLEAELSQLRRRLESLAPRE
jgi:hypothetical protein